MASKPSSKCAMRAPTCAYDCHANGPTEPSARKRLPKHGDAPPTRARPSAKTSEMMVAPAMPSTSLASYPARRSTGASSSLLPTTAE
jgi:hypothetical protein